MIADVTDAKPGSSRRGAGLARRLVAGFQSVCLTQQCVKALTVLGIDEVGGLALIIADIVYYDPRRQLASALVNAEYGQQPTP